jgi:hypothetical protein
MNLKPFFAVLLLLSFTAAAQPAVTRGGALLKRSYQTYAAATYFVDPTGSDSNACTASGTSACATLQGVVNKLPRNIRHTITINVAAGTYTGLTAITGFNIGPTAEQSVTGAASVTLGMPIPSISISGTGAWTNATLGTGSVTGSLTAVPVAPTVTPIAFGTLTDSTQSWTPGALKGMFFNPTSGTALNNRTLIVDNTATTISTMQPITGLASGDTYSIQLPGVTLGPVYVTNITGVGNASTGLVLFDSVNFITSSVAFAAFFTEGVGEAAQGASTGSYVGVALRRTRAIASGTASIAVGIGPRATLTTSSQGGTYWESSTTGLGAPPFSSTSGYYQNSNVQLNGPVFIRSLSTGGGGLDTSRFTLQGLPTTSFSIYEMNSAALSTVGMVLESGGDSWNSGSWYFRTVGATSAVCILQIYQMPAQRRARFCNVKLENCTTGVQVQGAVVSLASTAGSPCLTNGFTTSGVTNDLNIDGTNYSWTYLNTLTPPIIQTPYSKVGRF